MEQQEVKGDEVPIVDGGSPPTLFVDSIRGASLFDGVMRLNLFENRYSATESKLEAHHVATLAMTLQQFVAWQEFFDRTVKEMKEVGAIKDTNDVNA